MNYLLYFIKLRFALASFRFLRKMKSKFQDFTDLKSRVCKYILCGQRKVLNFWPTFKIVRNFYDLFDHLGKVDVFG